MKRQTKLAYLSQPNQQYTDDNSELSKTSFSRLKIFIVTFLFTLFIGLIINYARPAVYQSNATLLTSVPTAIDQTSMDMDIQHVIIQQKRLLGFELLTETLSRLHSSEDKQGITLPDIRDMLTVNPIDDTNLLNMTALGPEPEILPIVINTWIEVYLDARALNVKNSTNDTIELVKSELSELEIKIEQTRDDLDLFRKKHDISSTARVENESPARLKSLTNALNKANEDVIKTQARLNAVQQAIFKGDSIVPKSEQNSLDNLEKKHRELSKKLADFDQQFTRDYLKFKPSLKTIPRQLKLLENKIKAKQDNGKSIVLSTARQNFFVAKQVVAETRKQLDEQKKQARTFTSIFSKHKKFMNDLESMEKIQRHTRDRLVKIESKQFEKYPQVDVVERAGVNFQAISPDYNMGALIALIAALLLAFITVLLVEYLMHDKSEQNNFNSSVFTWLKQEQSYQSISSSLDDKVITQHNPNEIAYAPSYQQISDNGLTVLLNHTDNNGQQLILLLLSGLTLEEIAELKPEQINTKLSIIQISGHLARLIPIGSRIQKLLTESLKSGLLWRQQEISVQELNAILHYSLAGTNLNLSEEFFAENIRHNYILYLVEQGIQIAILSKVVGDLSPHQLAFYANHSPSGEEQDLDQIELIYPTCI